MSEPLTDMQNAAVQLLVDRSLHAKVNEINRAFRRTEVTNLGRLLEELDKEAADQLGRHTRLVKHLGDDISIQWWKMAKPGAVAERLKKFADQVSAESDKLMGRLDVLEAKAPKAFDKGHGILDRHNAELDSMEAGLDQLSNFPPLE